MIERERAGSLGLMTLAPLAGVALALVCLAAGSAARAAAPPARTTESTDGALLEHWLEHVRALASDAMRGRQTGSPEHRKSAEYVADQLRALGLKPGADGDYLQPVSFAMRHVRENECSLALDFDGRVENLKLGEDAILQMSVDAAEDLTAHAVFVGYGISVPEQDYDDLARADLKGKIAVFIQGGPDAVTEPRRSQAQSSAERWARLREAGAIGTISIRNPRHADLSWERAAAQRFTPGMGLADGQLDERSGQELAVGMNPAHAERLFEGSPHRFADLLALADSGVALPAFPLVPRVRARVRYDRELVHSENVVAILPGRDPALAGEYVVLTAHLDHLGVGAPVAGDSINNGAMDNASGVGVLIEVARALAAPAPAVPAPAAPGLVAPANPARSVVFAFVTGEEKGLLGSYYYSRRPTVPAASIVANITVDLVLPIVPLKHLVIHGVNESDLGDWARIVARESGIEVLPDPEPQRNRFIRSDQFNFIRIGVPALAFSTGAIPGSPEDSLLHAWVKQRYHQPADDLAQPFDREAPGDLIRFITRLTAETANAPSRPDWKSSSFFRRYRTPAP